MNKIIVVNKLVLGDKLMGYRFDIKENGSKLISLDINKGIVKAFLSLVEKDKIIKGYVIKGKIVGDMFVTDNEENVIQVTGKNQAIELLGKYYYGVSDDSIDGLLDDITSTKEDENKKYLEEFFSKPSMSLEGIRYEDFGYVPLVYSLIRKCSSGIDCRIDINDEEVDRYSAKVIFNIYFKSLEDAARYLREYYTFDKQFFSIKVPKCIADKLGNCTPPERNVRVFDFKILNSDDVYRCVNMFNIFEDFKNGEFIFNVGMFNISFDKGIYEVSTYAHTPGYRNEDCEEDFDVDEYDSWGNVLDNILYSDVNLKCVLPDFSFEDFKEDVCFIREVKNLKKYLRGLNCGVLYFKDCGRRNYGDYSSIIFNFSFSNLSEALILQQRILVHSGVYDVDITMVDLEGDSVRDLHNVDLLKTPKDFLKEVLSFGISQNSISKVVFSDDSVSKSITLPFGKYVVNYCIYLDGSYYEED